MEEIKGAAGFFNSSGRLRSKAELKEADLKLAKNQNSKEGSKAEAVSTEFSSKTKSAFRKYRNSISEQASKLITETNKQLDSAKDARSLTKKQIAVAKDLKEALNAGDQDASEKAREELSELNNQAKALEAKIDSDNLSSTSERLGSIRLGNQSRGTFQVQNVEFSATSGEFNITTVEDVNKFLAETRDTRASLNQQIRNLKGTRSDIRTVAKAARKDLGELGESVLDSVEAAQSKAAIVAGKLRFAADGDVSGVVNNGSLQTVHNLTEEAVARLIQN
jgi:hypothetical protein